MGARGWPTEVGSWPPFSTYVDAPSRRDATILRDRPGSNPLLLLNKIIVALGGTSTQRHRSSLAVSSPTLPTGVQTSTEGYCCGPALSWTLDRGPRRPCASRAAGRVDLAHGSEAPSTTPS
ncbi:hypothetical protein ACCO45_011193 [Purpureocillium lilacinum]|uniref:Uncharacterized protein n=1 Tax=Purpureocillium lilacinum TaxID=33203 RepID=A0ACC4DH17_PURLI